VPAKNKAKGREYYPVYDRTATMNLYPDIILGCHIPAASDITKHRVPQENNRPIHSKCNCSISAWKADTRTAGH